jgi:hypothetical protein
MHKNGKVKIKHLINLEEEDGKQKSLDRLRKRYNYLKSKQNKHYSPEPSNQMKYLTFHIKKLGGVV